MQRLLGSGLVTLPQFKSFTAFSHECLDRELAKENEAAKPKLFFRLGFMLGSTFR
jgi:hypothetical protein